MFEKKKQIPFNVVELGQVVTACQYRPWPFRPGGNIGGGV